ncbi:MAG: ABC-2 family transporter protein, partial [Bdellovibrionales bacterium]|nr:ABC-2 family transporter protein [Bdellovibrionales bacterium]
TMLEYQMWVLIISLFAQSYRGINLSEDIRFGRISTYLVYPFDFWKYHTAAFFGHQIIQLFVAALSLVILWAVSPVPLGSPSDWLIGLTYALFVSIFMFVLQFLCGLSAFWLEETWMFRILLSLIAQFCSGAIVPLELFPDIFRNVLNFTPFPYLTYIPVKLCMGTFTGSLPFMMFVLAMWMVIAVVATIVLWRLGLKNYTGAGM